MSVKKTHFGNIKFARKSSFGTNVTDFQQNFSKEKQWILTEMALDL